MISGRDLVGKHVGKPGSVEETSSTTTKTQTGKDGSKTTTTTTTTTKKTQGNFFMSCFCVLLKCEKLYVKSVHVVSNNVHVEYNWLLISNK